jgi:hypothetical protein
LRALWREESVLGIAVSKLQVDKDQIRKLCDESYTELKDEIVDRIYYRIQKRLDSKSYAEVFDVAIKVSAEVFDMHGKPV